MSNFDYFISYSSKDKYIADRIVAAIEQTGRRCWIAPRNIPYGMPYAKAIMQGMDSSDVFIVLLTDNSIHSDDVLNEVDNAHASKMTIIPVRLTQSELPRELNYYLSRTQWLTLNPNQPENITSLLNLSVAGSPLSGFSASADRSSSDRHPTEVINNFSSRTETAKTDSPSENKKKWTWTAGKIFGILLIILSALSLLAATFKFGPGDVMFTLSLFGCGAFLILLVIALIRPSLLGFKSRKESWFFTGLPLFLQLITTGINLDRAISVHPDACMIMASTSYDKYFTTPDAPLQSDPEIYEPLKKYKAAGDLALKAGNYEEAVKNYRYMAYDKSNDWYGQYMLGKCYFSGKGVEQDKRTAFEYFKSAATQGSAGALAMVGACYLHGEGTIYDVETAYNYISEAAKYDVPMAQSLLGEMYSMGLGVQENGILAVKWWKKAAENNDALAAFNIGRIYNLGAPGLEFDMNKVVHWYKKAADMGYAEAQNSMGVLHLTGNGVDKNPQKAYEYFYDAAMQKNAHGLYNLGNCYRDGCFVEANKAAAKVLYEEAIEQGSTSAVTAMENL